MTRLLVLEMLMVALALSPELLPELLPEPKQKVPLAQEAEVASIEGIWSVLGDTYEGVVVVRRLGQTYFLHYAVGRTDGVKGVFASASVGVGILSGDLLSVSWVQGGEKATGLSVYKVKGREMSGRWAPLPGGSIGGEKLRFLSGLPKE